MNVELKARTVGADDLKLGALSEYPGQFVRSPYWVVRAESPVVAGLLRRLRANKAPAWFAKALVSQSDPERGRLGWADDPVAVVHPDTIPAEFAGVTVQRVQGTGWIGTVDASLLALVLEGAGADARVTWPAINQPVAVWKDGELWGVVMPLSQHWGQVTERARVSRQSAALEGWGYRIKTVHPFGGGVQVEARSRYSSPDVLPAYRSSLCLTYNAALAECYRDIRRQRIADGEPVDDVPGWAE